MPGSCLVGCGLRRVVSCFGSIYGARVAIYRRFSRGSRVDPRFVVFFRYFLCFLRSRRVDPRFCVFFEISPCGSRFCVFFGIGNLVISRFFVISSVFVPPLSVGKARIPTAWRFSYCMAFMAGFPTAYPPRRCRRGPERAL